MSYHRACLTTWLLAVLLALLLAYDMVHAESGPFLDVAGGLTHFLVTTPDGDYLQKDLPHTFDLKSAAYKVGLGWRFNDRWSIQAGYVNFGTLNQSAQFVGDEYYNSKAPLGTRCASGCPGRSNYKITDAYHGGELTLTRSFKLSDDWAWHLKAGAAYLMHRFTLNRLDGTETAFQHYGRFPATVAGAGASYKWAYVEVDYYHGLGGSNGFMGQEQGWPLSKEMVVTWFGFKLPFGG